MRKVEVEWVDSFTFIGGWDTIESYIEQSHNMICYTIGYLLYQDDEKLVLGMAWDSENAHTNTAYVIPAVCIKSVTDLDGVSKISK